LLVGDVVVVFEESSSSVVRSLREYLILERIGHAVSAWHVCSCSFGNNNVGYVGYRKVLRGTSSPRRKRNKR
jgi:uncharacterized membrane protein YbhN (UPF0104 family)